ncbi:MAG: LicD family protein [Clostridiales bacterium]|nr:LicD family protein [Clostridiales bacterium]
METTQKPLLPPVSVLESVWERENADNLALSLDSLLDQSVLPDEIVLVKDGPLTPALDKVIDERAARHPGLFNIVALEKNGGLGNALRIGLSACKNEYVARMDSDDFSLPDRLEKQLVYLAAHPDVDILSGAVEEFDGEISNITGKRVVPLENDDIWAYCLTRSPFNHPACVYKKSAVERAGSYRGDRPRLEDHDLWMRMRRSGARAANLPDTLLYFRGGKLMHKKRHGLKNARALKDFYREMYLRGEVSYTKYLRNSFFACGLQLMPAWMHALCYKLLRSNTTPYTCKKPPRTYLPKGEYLLREEDPSLTKQRQETLLKMLSDVQDACDNAGLRLLLAGGSCLGAIRHRGFIPWDDDIDLVMPREDYDRLRRDFSALLGDRYVLCGPGTDRPSNLFLKILLPDPSAPLEPEQTSGERGVWVDIMPLDYAPANPVKRFFKGLYIDALNYLSVSCRLYRFRNPVYKAFMGDTLARRFKYRLRMLLGFLMSVKPYEYWFRRFDRAEQGEISAYLTTGSGIRHYLGELRPFDAFLPPHEAEFEGKRCFVPNKAHEYLKQQYGSDYLTPPPESGRLKHHFLKPEYGNNCK